MKKAITCAAAALLYMFTCGQPSMAGGPLTVADGQAGMTQTSGSQSVPRILINGDELHLKISPQWKDGVAFIPISDEVADALGVRISTGSGDPLTAVFHMTAYNIEFTAGQSAYTVRDVDMELPVAPYEAGGYLMVPVRELLEALGFSVKSDEAANLVEAKITLVAPELPSDIITTVFGGQQATSTAPQREGHPLEYTYDNLISFDNTAISGASGLSNLTGASALNNQFSMRLQKVLPSGYKFSGSIRTTETTDGNYNLGRIDKLAVNFAKGGAALFLYDITPRYTFYTLKNYQLRGVQYERKLKQFSWTAVSGKSPKILADSEYARYVQGFRIHRSVVKDHDIGFSFVRTRDAGSPRTTERYDNRILSFNANTKFKKRTKLMMEYAVSSTSINDRDALTSRARTAQAQYRSKKTMCTMVYDRTGAEFDSETAYFTAGRREASTICNHKYSSRTMYGAGMKKVLLGGEETRTIPLLFSMMPLKARPKMKLTLQKNFEKASSEDGSRITDVRSGGYSDELGKFRFDATIDRRKQKEAGGIMSFRNSQRYRAGAYITKKTEMTMQAKKELRTRGANARTRYSQLRFDHELKPWNDLTFALARYYNGTANNRTDAFVSFRKVNIDTNTEIGLEYRFLNYRDHNDNVVKLSYSFSR